MNSAIEETFQQARKELRTKLLWDLRDNDAEPILDALDKYLDAREVRAKQGRFDPT